MAKASKTQVGLGSILSTVSGPSTHEPPMSSMEGAVPADLIDKVVGSDVLSQTFPYNETKAAE